MAEEILKICNEINHSDIRAVLITSSNEKSFCSGADLKERNGMTDTEWKNEGVWAFVESEKRNLSGNNKGGVPY